MRKILYPGTFDPIHNGHIDIASRAAELFDQLEFVVAVNPDKKTLFSINKRIDLINEALLLNKIDTKLVYAESFDNLLIDFAKINSVSIIIRGLRVVSDFDYEFQMAGMNKRLNSNIETVFLMASETNQFIASRFVKEVASLGGDVSSFVPKNVNNEIIKKFSLIK